MLRFKIVGETVSKKNNKQVFVVKGKPVVTTSQRYKEWYADAKLQLEKQMKEYKEYLPIGGEISLVLNFYHSDNRRRDSDNGLSSILDLLVETGILVDDKWQIVRKLKVTNDKDTDSFCIISIDNI